MADHLEHHFSHQAQDESTLAEIGYKQELNRDWSLLHNFGISFSIIVRIPPILRGHSHILDCFGTALLVPCSRATEPGQRAPAESARSWIGIPDRMGGGETPCTTSFDIP